MTWGKMAQQESLAESQSLGLVGTTFLGGSLLRLWSSLHHLCQIPL
jgi:hypothetical protein